MRTRRPHQYPLNLGLTFDLLKIIISITTHHDLVINFFLFKTDSSQQNYQALKNTIVFIITVLMVY